MQRTRWTPRRLGRALAAVAVVASGLALAVGTPADPAHAADPPDTLILVRPPSFTVDTTATFTFSDPTGNAVAYLCALDDTGWFLCPGGGSTATFTGLAVGVHHLAVKSFDATSVVDPTPTSYEWAVGANEYSVFVWAHAVDATAMVVTTYRDAATVADMQCSVEGGTPFDCGGGSVVVPMPSPSVTIAVTVTLTGGATTVLTLGPIPTLPPTLVMNLAGPDEGSWIEDSTPTFGFVGGHDFQYRCSVDGGPSFFCSSGTTLGPLADGEHTFTVEAVDDVGYVGPTVTRHFGIDTTPSVLWLDVPTFLGGGYPHPGLSVPFVVSDDTVSVTCTQDGVPHDPCTSPLVLTLDQGVTSTVAFHVVDRVGHVSDSVVPFVATYPAVLPVVDLTGSVADGAATRERDATFTFTGTGWTGPPDTGTGPLTELVCALDGYPGGFPCSSPLTFTGLADGPHTMEVVARDWWGRISEHQAIHWTVDTVAPTLSFAQTPPATTTSTTATFAFDAHDAPAGPGPDAVDASVKVRCSLDGVLPVGCTDGITYSDLPVGPHTLVAVATDEAGNDTRGTYAWTIQAEATTTTSTTTTTTSTTTTTLPTTTTSTSTTSTSTTTTSTSTTTEAPTTTTTSAPTTTTTAEVDPPSSTTSSTSTSSSSTTSSTSSTSSSSTTSTTSSTTSSTTAAATATSSTAVVAAATATPDPEPAVAATGTLPVTGSSPLPLLAVALTLVGGGTVLLHRRRA